MIFYFSATGNSKYIVEQIAKATNDSVCSIVDCIKDKNYQYHLHTNENLGIVTPTYAWELPIIVREFLEQFTLPDGASHYKFCVSTYGTTPGASGAEAKHILKKKGILLDALYSVKMPDTWTVLFDLSNPHKVNAINEKAEIQLHKVIKRIQEHATGNHMNRNVPYAVRLFSDQFYEKLRKTDNFHVEDTCIGCNLCAKKCPMNAIELKNGQPTWTTDKCAMCFGCLHRCPKFAIQYNNKTAHHGQYTHPKANV